MHRILIVDDEEVVRKLLVRALNAWGYSVDTADNGESALVRLERTPYDLVITDYEMPGRTGPELSQLTLQKGLCSKIIGMSGEDREKDFLAGGALAFLSKPVSLVLLKNFLEKVLPPRVSKSDRHI